MSLGQLSAAIVRLGQSPGSTPVLVLPSHLSLRPAFFLALSEAISRQTDRPVRFDWLHTDTGLKAMIIGRLAAWRVTKINRSLCAASIRIAASIGRSGHADETLVIGLSDDRQALPPWAIAIPLGDAPSGDSAPHDASLGQRVS